MQFAPPGDRTSLRQILDGSDALPQMITLKNVSTEMALPPDLQHETNNELLRVGDLMEALRI